MEMMIMPGRVLRNNQVCKDEDHGVAGENPVSAVNMLTDIMVTRYIVKRWTDGLDGSLGGVKYRTRANNFL